MNKLLKFFIIILFIIIILNNSICYADVVYYGDFKLEDGTRVWGQSKGHGGHYLYENNIYSKLNLICIFIVIIIIIITVAKIIKYIKEQKNGNNDNN